MAALSEKIVQVKVELFDLIERQSVHQAAAQQIEQLKLAKLKELDELRQAEHQSEKTA